MMMFPSAAAPTLVLLALAASTAHGSLLRGFETELESPFTCLFSGATDGKSCVSVSSDDGTPCVWCTSPASDATGVCVTSSQSQTLIDKFHMDCSSIFDDDDDAATDDKAPDDDAANNDDDFMDGLLDCLTHGDDEDACSASKKKCVWCESQMYGVCITEEAAETVDTYKYFDCSKKEEEGVTHVLAE